MPQDVVFFLLLGPAILALHFRLSVDAPIFLYILSGPDAPGQASSIHFSFFVNSPNLFHKGSSASCMT
jgi:hypothetical protein